MDKVHSATRPAWALHTTEVLFTSGLALFCSASAISLSSEYVKTKLAPHLLSREISETFAIWIVDVVVTLLLTLFSILILRLYKRYKTHRYPASYVYCFERTDYIADPLTGRRRKGDKVFVVGGLWLYALNNGGILARGEAYDWRDRAIVTDSKMKWTSEHVGTTEGSQRIICFIAFTVDKGYEDKREYKEGLIRFEAQRLGRGVVANGTVYRGEIHGIDPPSDKIAFYAKAYAEHIGKEMNEEGIRSTLGRFGQDLIDRWRSA